MADPNAANQAPNNTPAQPNAPLPPTLGIGHPLLLGQENWAAYKLRFSSFVGFHGLEEPFVYQYPAGHPHNRAAVWLLIGTISDQVLERLDLNQWDSTACRLWHIVLDYMDNLQ